MKSLIITIALYLIGCSISAQNSSTSDISHLTLEECISIALKNNRNIKQQSLNRRAKEIAYNQARSNLLPSFNASMGQNFTFGRSIGMDNTYQNTNSAQSSFGISGNITLFDGLKMKYNIDARRAEMNAAEADMEKIEEDIRLSVSTAFLHVLLNKELKEIALEQTQLTKASIEHRRELIRNGKMAEGEIYELEAQSGKEELSLIQADNAYRLSLLDLAQIMDIERFDNIEIVAPPELSMDGNIFPSAERVYEQALINRPEVHSMQFRIKSGEREIQIAKSAFYPTLTFGASTGTGYYNMSGRENQPFGSQIKNNLSNSLGFSLSIPIFNKFQIRNGVRNAELLLENSLLEMDKLKFDLRKRVEQAYQNAVGAEARWRASKKAEKAVREAYRFAEQKFENGRASSYELYQAKNRMAQILSEQAQAKYEYAFRVKILELLGR